MDRFEFNFIHSKGKLILKEMLDALALSLVDKKLVTNQIIITIGYDIENVTAGSLYREEIITDRYGRKIPACPWNN